jgi:hypothetical protein
MSGKMVERISFSYPARPWREAGQGAKAEEKVMNLPTKLAITGVGVAVLMPLAFLTLAPAMAQIASCTTDASGNTVCDPTRPARNF